MTAIKARIVLDSRSPCGTRLTTFELTYPRIIHSEFMTHRLFSRNAASSRAIPVDKMLQRIEEDTFIPHVWGRNQKGMQGAEEVIGTNRIFSVAEWKAAMYDAVRHARNLQGLGLHKQIVNRVTEPYMWITVLASTTDLANHQALRDHKDAEPHYQILARSIGEAVKSSVPQQLGVGEWHLPFIYKEDWGEADDWAVTNYSEIVRSGVPVKTAVVNRLVKVSMGRCARVSYLTHDGKRDHGADVALHDRLVVQEPAHASPSEHVAAALDWPQWFGEPFDTAYDLRAAVTKNRRERASSMPPSLEEMRREAALGELASGNFLGFRQYRKTMRHEHSGGLMP